MAQKQAVTTSTAPTPLGQYSQAVKAGPFVYVAGQLASDFKTGIAAEAKIVPGFPYYDIPMKLQADYTLRNISAVLDAAGSSMDDVAAFWTFLTDVSQTPYQSEAKRKYFKRIPTSTTVGIKGLAVAGAQIEIDLIAVTKDGPYRLEYIETDRAPIPPGGRYAQAIKAGPYVFTAGQVPTDFVHTIAPAAQTDPQFPYFEKDIKKQTAYILDNIKAVLEAAGSSLDNVVKALIFLTDSRQFLGLDEVWKAYFPKDPPARSIAPAEILFPSAMLEIQVVAVAPDGHVKKEVVTTDRAPRPTIHQSQAIKAGDIVFLSGLMATDYKSPIAPEAQVNPAFPNHGVSIKRQMEYILDTADTILREAGSGLEHMVRRQNYLTDFAGEMPAFREVTRARFGGIAPASTTIEVASELIVPACTVMIDSMAVVPNE